MGVLMQVLSSSAFGAVIGLLGSWLTKREERKNHKIKSEYEFKMAELKKAETELKYRHELELAEKKIEGIKTQGTIDKDLEELKAFKESVKTQSKNSKIKIVDAIRGLMRPTITLYLLVIGTIIAINLHHFAGGIENSLSAPEVVIMYRETIAQIMFLLTTAITWWFGSRPSSSRIKN